MAKRIRVTRVPFNYYWPKVSAVSCINQLGPALVKDEIAEAAIARGYAEPFNPVTKPATRRRKRTIKKPDAPTSNGIHGSRLDREDMADDDSASDIVGVEAAE